MTQQTSVKELLTLRVPPIGIGFFSEPPAGVEHYGDGQAPAGCSFWQRAQEGHVFYATAEDQGCAVGLYTHNLTPPEAAVGDLEDTIGMMVENRYIEMDDVAGIPTLDCTPQVVAYGPADSGAFTPDIVIVAAEPARAMLLFEAAIRVGAGDPEATIVPRPSCAVVPQAVNNDRASLSFGCIGNRTYTGLPDSEMYVAIPGDRWEAVASAVEEIVNANASMEAHYRGTLVT